MFAPCQLFNNRLDIDPREPRLLCKSPMNRSGRSQPRFAMVLETSLDDASRVIPADLEALPTSAA